MLLLSRSHKGLLRLHAPCHPYSLCHLQMPLRWASSPRHLSRRRLQRPRRASLLSTWPIALPNSTKHSNGKRNLPRRWRRVGGAPAWLTSCGSCGTAEPRVQDPGWLAGLDGRWLDAGPHTVGDDEYRGDHQRPLGHTARADRGRDRPNCRFAVGGGRTATRCTAAAGRQPARRSRSPG